MGIQKRVRWVEQINRDLEMGRTFFFRSPTFAQVRERIVVNNKDMYCPYKEAVPVDFARFANYSQITGVMKRTQTRKPKESTEVLGKRPHPSQVCDKGTMTYVDSIEERMDILSARDKFK